MPPAHRQLRDRRAARVTRVTVVAALAAGLTACGGSSKKPAPSPSSSPAPTTSSSQQAGRCADLLRAPRCVLWGVSADASTVDAVERAIGQKFDLVYFFDSVDSGDLPTSDERQAVADGQTLHINIESREFNKPDHPDVKWSDIAAGAFDSTLTTAAKGLASLHKPFFITFDHEADNKDKLAARGTPAQFVAAWKHVRKVFEQAGATQAIWTWVVTGYPGNNATAQALYPGNGQVDWISWDPYDSRGCQNGAVGSDPAQTFADVAKPFYDWLATTGAKAGISLKKPYMISETGSAYDPKDPQAAAAFYASIPAGLKQLPRIRAVTLWPQSAGDCNYQISGIPQLQPALRAAAQQLQHLSS